MRALIAIALALAVLSSPTVAAPDRQDVDTMAPAEVSALQQRLTDAQCYSGPIDGRASEATKAAVAACPDQRPQLRIETGMHTAVIWRIAVDADCTRAATASDDKTVRLWSLPNGRLLRVLRWPIGTGHGGKVFATAMSPDGRFVAAGGWDAGSEVYDHHAVTIFDATTGAIVARVDGFENVISHFAYSSDGRWLAATLGSAGVRLIDTSIWRVVAADRAYGEGSYGAVFGPDGRLYTTSWDGKIRRYGPSPAFREEGEVATRGGKRPFAIGIDPGGKRIVVGFNDSTAVDLYDAPTLRFHGHVDAGFADNGNLESVAWRNDGRAFIVGGEYDNGGGDPAIVFDRNGRRLGQQVAISTNTITDFKRCGDGFAVAVGDPAFGLLGTDGGKSLWKAGVTADMRNKLGDAFALAPDARRVRFGLDGGDARSVLFDLTSATLTESPTAPADLAKPSISGLPVKDWEDNRTPRFDGAPIALNQNETARSLAIRLDRGGFVLGNEYSLRTFDAVGKERWQRPVPGVAWGVNLSAEGRIIVAAYADGTIRWHRWSDGQELLALFVNKQTKAWVAWTPSGYYSASPGGEDLIGWNVNRGWAQVADFFPASKFRDTYSRPDIVERVLDTLDEAEAIRQADAARPRKAAAAPAPITERLPPVLSILSPVDGATVDGETVRVDYLVRSPSGLPVDDIEARVNGRPVSSGHGLGRLADTEDLPRCIAETHGLGRTEGALQGCRGHLDLTLPPGTSLLSVFAKSGKLASAEAQVQLTRAAAASGTELMKPKLYALVVGISAYRNSDYALAYASKDARDFAASLQNQKGGLYRDVEVKTLSDGEATAAAIREGLEWITRAVTQGDTGIIYLAGHGLLDERDRFYFLAADSDAQHLRSTAVQKDEIADALDALAGKAILFLDACHAGAIAESGARRGVVDINTIVNDFSRGEHGVVTFAASTGRQTSQENATWGNGAFTKAVVEGLGSRDARGKADLLGKGTITTSELDVYVRERVKELTDGTQSPVMERPATVPDFAFALSR